MTKIGVVGDIHGLPGPLLALLERIDTRVEMIVFLGDYVDRGPGAADVIEILLATAETRPCVFLEGNHDAAFRTALRGEFDRYLALGGAATVRSYISPPYQDVASEWRRSVPASHRTFLDELVPTFKTSELLIGHVLPEEDGTGRFRIGGHSPQLAAVPSIGTDHAYVDTGCGTLDDGMLTCLYWPSLTWDAVPT